MTCASGEDALGILARQKIGCMIAEARLFGAGGGELLSRSLARDPNLAVLVLSSRPDVADAVRYLQYGAMDYLPKPLDLPGVEAALQRALRRRTERIQERGAARLLKEELVNLGAELARERAKVEGLTVATLEALVCVVEARDTWFVGHSLRVAQLAASIAAELGRTDEEVESVRRAGLLHDIGMIVVPEGIMGKEGTAQSRGARADQAPRDRRRRDPRPAAAAGTGRRVRAGSPRALGWAGIPRWPGRRGDPLGCPAHRRGRALRRLHHGTTLPRPADPRDGGGEECSA